MVVAYGDRIIGVKSYDMSVFYKYTRYTVYGSRNNKFVVEPDALCVRGNPVVKVGSTFRTESQMPFAYCTGCVSCIFQHICHGDAGSVDNEFRVTGSDSCVFLSPRIHTCQESETGRGAGGRSCISIGELYSLSCQPVNVGSAHFCCSITT